MNRIGPVLRHVPGLLLWIGGGLCVIALIIRLAGASPLAVADALWVGAFGSKYNVADTCIQAVPLLLTGLGVAIAFRSQVFNIGAEGQLLVGAMAATCVGTSALPAPILLPLALISGAVAGAGWSAIAACLRLWRGVPEVLSTLLLNFIAIQLLAFMVRGPLQEARGDYPQSDAIRIGARLALLVPQTRLHGGVILAIVLAVTVWFYLRFTAGGFALRVVGAGAPAAEAAGIRVAPTLWKAFLLSGALSGLAGAVQLCGVIYRLSDGFSPGYGYTAIAVALLAGSAPLGVIISAFFFGAITAGGASIQQRVPGVSSVVVQVLQAVALLALLGWGWARENRFLQRRTTPDSTRAEDV